MLLDTTVLAALAAAVAAALRLLPHDGTLTYKERSHRAALRVHSLSNRCCSPFKYYSIIAGDVRRGAGAESHGAHASGDRTSQRGAHALSRDYGCG